MEFQIRDNTRNRTLERWERFGLFIDCGSGRIYKYKKQTYYGGDPFIDVSDRYTIEEERNEHIHIG